MSFLNKKHIPTFSQTNTNFASQNSNSKTFNQTDIHGNQATYISNRIENVHNTKLKQSPKILYQNISNSRVKQKEAQNYASSYSGNYTLKKQTSTANISTNLCSQHQNEVLRHLCLECNQLLCSQCISDHLQGHRQTTKTIPKIQTINKLRKQMTQKSEQILQFMQQNNPKVILPDLSMLRLEAVSKIQQMKSQVIKAFDQWCRILQNHVVEDLIKIQDLRQLQQEMQRLKSQVSGLHNHIRNQPNVPVQIVKKIHQIDSEKLEAAYLQMFNTFTKSVLKSKFVFDYDWKYLMQSFEKSITLRPLHPATNNRREQSYEGETYNAQNYQEEDQLNRNDIEEEQQNIPLIRQNVQFDRKIEEYGQIQTKGLQIQSIESFIQPTSQHSLYDRLADTYGQNVEKDQSEDRKVERKMSRQGSGKRLAIFATTDNKLGENNEG